MSKQAVTIFSFVLIIGLVFSFYPRFGSAQNSKLLNGIITQDTILTKTSSPYNLTGNVLIEKDVTVTVEANAVVNLNGYYIRVNGSLIIQPSATLNMGLRDSCAGYIQVNGIMAAKGANTQPIYINGAEFYWENCAPPTVSAIVFSEYSSAWNNQTGLGCIIENAIINKTDIQTSSSIKLNNNTINVSGIKIVKGAPLISNNILSNGISVTGGSPIISCNQLNDGFISLQENHDLDGIDSPIVTGNTISNPPSALLVTTSAISLGGFKGGDTNLIVIEKNLITNSSYGIYFGKDTDYTKKPIQINNNTITGNEVGIGIADDFSPEIVNNNIYNNNMSVKLSLSASSDVEASNNWWGTTDASLIDESIFDFYDDFNLGKVNYTPFLTAPNTQAMPNPKTQIPPQTTPSSSLSLPSLNDNSSILNFSGTEENSSFFGLSSIDIAITVLFSVVLALLSLSICLRKRRM